MAGGGIRENFLPKLLSSNNALLEVAQVERQTWEYFPVIADSYVVLMMMAFEQHQVSHMLLLDGETEAI